MRGACLFAALAVLAGCTSTLNARTIVPQPIVTAAGAVIPLGINDGNKPGYHLTIAVGGGQKHDVLLDTGSAGLWIYPNAIGAYRATTIEVDNTYGSGLHYKGVIVHAKVDFGDGLLTGDMPMALVKTVDCKGRPVCAATPGSKYCPTVKPGKDAGIRCLEAGRKLYGTFGADMTTIPAPKNKPVDELYNGIFAIARPWAYAFAVTPNALLVGPQPLAGYTTMPLTPQTGVPKPLPNGAKGWNRDVQVCYTIASLKHRCFRTLFDTGAANVDFQANVTLPQSSASCGDRVVPGTKFLAQTREGTTIASFAAGNETNFNRIVVSAPKNGRAQVNTGMTLFNRNAIYYDAERGIVGITPLAKPVNIATKGCGTD